MNRPAPTSPSRQPRAQRAPATETGHRQPVSIRLRRIPRGDPRTLQAAVALADACLAQNLGGDAAPGLVIVPTDLSRGYSHLLMDPAGRVHDPLSLALSLVAHQHGRCADSQRQYFAAFTAVFGPLAKADPDWLDVLMRDVGGARSAVLAALRLHGFRVRISRYADGSYTVEPPLSVVGASPPRNFASVAGVKRVTLALVLLRNCFDALALAGRWPHANPMRVDNHLLLSRLLGSSPAPPWASPFARYAGNQFNLTGRAVHYPDLDATAYTPIVLEQAKAWPAPIALATRIAAATGARISEILALTLEDWVVRGAERELQSINKGSRGVRTKMLIIPQALADDLATYVDTVRGETSHIGMRQVRRWAQPGKDLTQINSPAISEPLLQGHRGQAITPRAYRDTWFRPAMTALGLNRVTPHRLRHEHCLRALLFVRRQSATPEIEAARIEEFAQLQGWRSGAAMAHYYAPQFRALAQRELADSLYAADTSADAAIAASAQWPAPAHHNPAATQLSREITALAGELS